MRLHTGYLRKRLHEALHHRLRGFWGGRLGNLCRPTSIFFLITERCNARCVHCNIWTNRGREDALSEAEWKAALDDLRRWLGPVQITLTGGEALLVPYTPDLVRHGAELGLFMEVLTHGYWNDKSRIEALARARPWRITMSLDGLGEVHSLIRGRRAFFERTASSLDTLLRLRRTEGLPYTIRIKTVIMQQNLAELGPGSSVTVSFPALMRSGSSSPSKGYGPTPSMPFSECSTTGIPSGTQSAIIVGMPMPRLT